MGPVYESTYGQLLNLNSRKLIFEKSETKIMITKLNILFIHNDPEVLEEIREFLTVPDGDVFFSKDTNEAIRILNEQTIGMVVLKINNLRDAAILRYINENYKDLEVLVMASREYDEIISAFSAGQFTLYSQPLKLSELKLNIDQLIKGNINMKNTSI
jgi:DNA-binding NtrC family response regulator